MTTQSTAHDKDSGREYTLDPSEGGTNGKDPRKFGKQQSKSVFHRVRSAINWTLPFLTWIADYSVRKSLLHDLTSGLHIGLYQIPHCLALSIICGRPAIHAFFSFVVASMIYTFLGSHRRLNYGIFSLVSSLYLGIIIDRAQVLHHRLEGRHAPPLDVDKLTALITLVIGIYSFVACIFRVGSLLRFVPYEVLSSFRAGLYLLLAILQLNSMCGLDLVSRLDLEHGMEQLILPRLIYNKFYPHVGKWENHNSLFVSIGCLAILFAFRLLLHFWPSIFRNKFPKVRSVCRQFPVEFLLLFIGMFVAKYWKKFPNYKIIVVNEIGHDNSTIFDIKHLHLQTPNFEHYQLIWGECISAALMLILFAHSLACDFNVLDTEIDPEIDGTRRIQFEINPSRVQYVRHGWAFYTPNRELLSIGVMNILASFLRCLPIGPSDFGSLRLRSIGGKSQLACFVSGLVMIVAWFCLHEHFFPYTPQCVVASIVAFDCCCRLFQEIQQLNRFWAIAPIDLAIWALTFSSFVFLNIEFSLYLSMALSLIVYIYRGRIFWRKQLAKQKLVTLTQESALIVSEKITQDPQTSGSLTFFPMDQLKEIEIFQITEEILTVSNVDSFVCEIFKRLQQSMKSDSVNRFVFDCHTVRRMDWFAVRTVKALIDRLVEIEQSWLAIHSFILEEQQKNAEMEKNDSNNGHSQTGNGLELRTIVEKTSESRLLVMTFVFPPKIARLIKSVKQPLNYVGFQKSLNLSLRGAFCSILNSLSEQGVPEIRTINSSENRSGNGNGTGNGTNHEIVEIAEDHKQGQSIEMSLMGGNSASVVAGNMPEMMPEMPKKKKTTKVRQRLSSYFRSASTPSPVQVLEADDEFQVVKELGAGGMSRKGTGSGSGNGNEAVTPLSFRQTDDEFSLNSSTLSSAIAPPVVVETFPRAPAPSQPRASTSAACYPVMSPFPPPPPPPPPPASAPIIGSFHPSFVHQNSSLYQPSTSGLQQPRRPSEDSDIRRKLETLFNPKTTFL